MYLPRKTKQCIKKVMDKWPLLCELGFWIAADLVVNWIFHMWRTLFQLTISRLEPWRCSYAALFCCCWTHAFSIIVLIRSLVHLFEEFCVLKFSSTSLWFQLGGKRVGIVGLGNIGSQIAKRLVAFGCSIAYNSRKKKPSVPFPYYANVWDLAANSDVLIVCCALTEDTHHIINKDVTTALGKEGVIINVGRGPLVDEKELVQFLVRGEIGGAGLDVFENEPDVPKELFKLDNVVLSPHCAVVTLESFAAVQDLVMANLKAFFSNKPLVSLVQNE